MFIGACCHHKHGSFDEHDHKSQEIEQFVFDPDEELHQEIVTHVAWTRCLPQRERENLGEHETGLTELMIDAVDWFVQKNILPQKTIEMFNDVFNVKTATNAAEIVSSQINQLKAGEMMGMHVAQQNCGFVVYKLPGKGAAPSNEVVVTSFPVSVSADELFKLKNGYVQVKKTHNFD